MKKIITTMSIIGAVLLLLLLSSNPIPSMNLFLFSIFKGSLFFGNFVSRVTILLFCGCAAWISISVGKINLGGEGNVAVGGISTIAIMILLKGLSPVLVLPISLLAAVFSGYLTSSVSTILYKKLNIDTLITSFLVSLMFVYISNTLITTIFSSPDSYLITTVEIDNRFRIDSFLQPSKGTYIIFLALLIVPIISFLWNRSKIGYEMKITGQNSIFAEYGGINSIKRATQGFKLSGILYSIAGFIIVTTVHYSAPLNFQSGWGWQGITVALIAGRKPIMLLPSALLLGWLAEGATNSSLLSGTSIELNGIIQGLILLLITSRLLTEKKSDI